MELFILATSDVHGYIMPTDYVAGSCFKNLGLAKAASVIEAVRREHEHIIYIDNGDLIQGSALAQYNGLQHFDEGPKVIIEALNEMHCDASVLGNHEFNYGLQYLRKGIQKASFPILAANVIDIETNEPAFQPYTIIERNSVKIAILGLVTEFVPKWEKPDHIEGLRFESCVQSAKFWVPKLRQEADVVIVAYHGGFEYDPFSHEKISIQSGENIGLQLLKEVKGIDAFISGHQHRELAGVYEGVPLVMPGWRAQAVGLIRLVLERKSQNRWSISAHDAVLLRNGRAESNQKITNAGRSLHKEVEEWLDLPIGFTDGDMRIVDPIKDRSYLHPYANFINQIQMEISGVDISCTSIFKGDCIGFPHEISVRHIVNNYIYTNTLAVLKITGKNLRDALERCARFFDIDKNGKLKISDEFSNPFIQYYNYDIYSGIQYTMDIRNSPGKRIVQLDYHGRQIKDDDQLKIVMNNYRSIGGGEYPMYGKDKIIQDIQIDMTDLIVEYIISHHVIVAEKREDFKVLF